MEAEAKIQEDPEAEMEVVIREDLEVALEAVLKETGAEMGIRVDLEVALEERIPEVVIREDPAPEEERTREMEAKIRVDLGLVQVEVILHQH